MLKFVFGPAASGKTYTIHNMIKKDIENGKSNIILLVPEQYSFETEREILRIAGSGYSAHVDVVGFTQLFENVGRIYGGVCAKRITDAERILLMGQAVKKVLPHLSFFKKASNSTSFLKEITSTISEFKLASISSNQLKQFADECENPAFSQKISDISLIYSEYDSYIKNVFIDPLDQLDLLYFLAEKNGYFKNKTVYIDAFKGFTGQQLKLLKLIISSAENTVFSLGADNGIDDKQGIGVFSNIKKIYSSLKNYAKDNNIQISDEIILEKSRYQNAEIEYLEKVLSEKTREKYSSDAKNLSVLGFNNPIDELDFVFKKIHNLVRTKEYKYSDFVIIARDIDKYQGRLELAYKKYNVPCYFDKRKSLMSSSVTRFALSLLNAAKDFNTKDIFSMLKTDFFDITLEETSKLYDYVFIWNIDKKSWLDEWNMNPFGLETKYDVTLAKKELEQINEIRKRVIKPLITLNKAFNLGVKQVAETLFNLLISCQVDKKLNSLCKEIANMGDFDLADFLAASYDEMLNCLDSIVYCFNEQKVSATEFIDMLTLSFSFSSVATIPRMIDEVSCGSADRIRPARPKVVFAIGLNQGEFPAISSDNGLISKNDRKILKTKFNISDNFKEFAVDENYLLYSSLCCALEKVFISYHDFTLKGEKTEKSSVISKLLKIFENCQTQVENYFPETEREAFTYLVANYNKNPLALTIKEILSQKEIYKEKIQKIENSAFKEKHRLSEDVARKTFDGDLYLSASKIENYNKCAFSYFCKYVLNIQKPQKAELNNLKRGTIVHFVLEKVISKLGANISDVSAKEIENLVNKSLKEYLNKIIGNEFIFTKRFQFLYSEMGRMLKYILLHISKEFKNSDFVPDSFELNIGGEDGIPALEIKFNTNNKTIITGQIDRVDICENSNKFVRIVDYKTGNKSFNLTDVLYGINLQMLLYLYAVKTSGIEKYPDFLPAGILYMPSNRGFVNSKGKSNLTMNGMLLDDEQALKAMDKNSLGFIPENSKTSHSRIDNPFVSYEDFETIYNFINYKVAETSANIKNGNFDICPKILSGDHSCKYCDFAAVCGIEEDYNFKEIKNINSDEVIQKMQEVLKSAKKLD